MRFRPAPQPVRDRRAFPRMVRATAAVLVLSLLGGSVARADDKPPIGPMDPVKLKHQLTSHHGKEVEIKTPNGTIFNGIVVAIGDDSFDITPKFDAGRKVATPPTVIPYTQVASVKFPPSHRASVTKNTLEEIAIMPVALPLFFVVFVIPSFISSVGSKSKKAPVTPAPASTPAPATEPASELPQLQR